MTANVRGWAIPAFLIVVAGLGTWALFPFADRRGYAVIALFLLAALLTIPPLWRVRASLPAFIRYVWLMAVVLLVAIAFTLPVETHAIKIDIPSDAAPQTH